MAYQHQKKSKRTLLKFLMYNLIGEWEYAPGYLASIQRGVSDPRTVSLLRDMVINAYKVSSMS